MKVLVVEDDPVTRKVLQALLSKAGFEVSVQANGTLGLAAACAAPEPAIIVLDWMLPDMEGPALCRQIVAARTENPPYILFLSARASKDDIAKGFDAGADDYVTKPIHAAELASRLKVARRWLERVGASHSAAAPEPAAALNTLPKPESVWTDPSDFSDVELGHFSTQALREIRLGLDRIAPPMSHTLDGADYMGWVSYLITSHDLWLDVSILAQSAVLGRLHERKRGARAQGTPDLENLVREIAEAVGLALHRCLVWRGATLRSPVLPIGRLLDRDIRPPVDADEGAWHEFIIEGEPIRVALHARRCPVRSIAPDLARRFDILDGPFPAPEFSEVPIFHAGSILTARFVEKLTRLAEDGDAIGNLSLRRPSTLAGYLLTMTEARRSQLGELVAN